MSTSTSNTPSADCSVVVLGTGHPDLFQHVCSEGLWEGIPVVATSLGAADAQRLLQPGALPASIDVTVVEGLTDAKQAWALQATLADVATGHVMIARDIDVLAHMEAFTADAQARLSTDEDVLLVAMPQAYAFDKGLNLRAMDVAEVMEGLRGGTLLAHLVAHGRSFGLPRGACFRTGDLKGVLPETLLGESGGVAMLMRLCAQYPFRQVTVAPTGAALTFADAHEPRPTSLADTIAELLTVCIGATYLIAWEVLDLQALINRLQAVGAALEEEGVPGRAAADTLCRLILGEHEIKQDAASLAVLAYLQKHQGALPVEFISLLSEEGLALISGEKSAQVPTATPYATPLYFVGGAPHTGAGWLERQLEAVQTVRTRPQARTLTGLLQSYREGRKHLSEEVPAFYTDADDHADFHGLMIGAFLERTLAREDDQSRLVIHDEALTPYFPDLHALCPAARFICIVRDPRDVVAAMLAAAETQYHRLEGGSLSPDIKSSYVATAAEEVLRTYSPLIAMAQGTNPVVHTIRYEDIVLRPTAVLEGLEAFTGLTMPPQAVDHSAPAGLTLVSDHHAPKVVGRSEYVLDAQQVSCIEQVCSELFHAFGYARTNQAYAA